MQDKEIQTLANGMTWDPDNNLEKVSLFHWMEPPKRKLIVNRKWSDSDSVVPTSNGFLHLDDDDSGDDLSVKEEKTEKESKTDRQCKKLSIKNYVDQRRDNIKKRRCRIQAFPILESFEAKNMFGVFQKLNQSQVDEILGSKNEVIQEEKTVISQKKRCKSCGYKKVCHLQSYCKAQGKLCYTCCKPNHFPKSRNCKMMNKSKSQRNSLKKDGGNGKH